MRGLDEQPRSRRFWVVAGFCVIASCWLIYLIDCFVLFPVWMKWNPGRTVGYWLLDKTSSDMLAARVPIFFLYIPELMLLLAGGLLLPVLFRRRWLRVALLASFTYLVIEYASWFILLGAAVVEWGWRTFLILSVVRTCVAAAPLLGAWLSSRYFRYIPPDPSRCRQCGYALCGLPGNRCPECGTEFQPHAANTD